MSEQPAELQRICGTGGCAVTQVFRSFKIAFHHSKLLLALAAIILTGIWGGVLDGIWLSGQQPVADEVNAFWQTEDIHQWRDLTFRTREARVRGAFDLVGVGVPADIQKELKDDPRKAVNQALHFLETHYSEAAKGKDEQSAAALARRYLIAHETIARGKSTGVFCSFLNYETACVRQFIDSAATLRVTGGVHEILHARGAAPFHPAGEPSPGDASQVAIAQALTDALRAGASADGNDAIAPALIEAQLMQPRLSRPGETKAGMLASLVLMARGVQWLLQQHPLFAILFGLGKLAIWALFGGAICRMAALNYARDERIPLKTAMAFAWRKYLGFVTAPLMPLGMILLIGVVLWVGGLVGLIPGVGEVLAGLGMVLALLGGFVIALIFVGFVAGGSLMWPTVAVEGSDSFDALSRSYSYVYQRPWKAALYALAASVYGALCYLFVRFFVFIALRGTRTFVAAGMNWKTARPGTGAVGAGKLDAMWPMPSFDSLWHNPSPFGYLHAEWVGMWMIKIWVMLAVLALCAFLASFYFSSSTIIYFLLRREVDSTDLEDVDAEDQSDEDIMPATISDAGTGGTP